MLALIQAHPAACIALDAPQESFLFDRDAHRFRSHQDRTHRRERAAATATDHPSPTGEAPNVYQVRSAAPSRARAGRQELETGALDCSARDPPWLASPGVPLVLEATLPAPTHTVSGFWGVCVVNVWIICSSCTSSSSVGSSKPTSPTSIAHVPIKDSGNKSLISLPFLGLARLGSARF